MTKTQLWNEVETLLGQYKVSKEFKAQLEELIKPKAGGGIVQNPMNTVDNVNYHFCRYTNYYLPESEMVMSNGKSKGYSKKAIAKWTKLGKKAKDLEATAMKLLLEKNFEEGTEVADRATKLLNDRNKTSMYDDIRSEYESIKLND